MRGLLSILFALVVSLPAAAGQQTALAEVSAAAVATYHEQSARDLSIATRTRVPLAEATDAEFVIFRGGDGLHDQLSADGARVGIAKLEHFRELVAGVDVQQREWNLPWIKSFLG